MALRKVASFGIPVTSLDASSDGAGTNGTAFGLPGNHAIALSWTTSFGTTPGSCTILLQLSLDGITYYTGDTSTSTAGELRTINTAAKFARIRISAQSGGTTVTGIINTQPYSATIELPNPFNQDLNTTDNVEFDEIIANELTVGILNAGSLIYPVVDGNNLDVLSTDGNGNLSFQSIGTIVNPFDQDLNTDDDVLFANIGSAYVAATGILNHNGVNVSNNDTVRIGGQTYTFKTILTPSDWQVEIGIDADTSLFNLFCAINKSPGVTTYQVPTPNLSAYASLLSAPTLTVTSRTAGLVGNSIISIESSPWTWGSPTLLGGIDGSLVSSGTFLSGAFGINPTVRDNNYGIPQLVIGVGDSGAGWAVQCNDGLGIQVSVGNYGTGLTIAPYAPGDYFGSFDTFNLGQGFCDTVLQGKNVDLFPQDELRIFGTPGFTGTITTASLVGKTITITKGIITGFAP